MTKQFFIIASVVSVVGLGVHWNEPLQQASARPARLEAERPPENVISAQGRVEGATNEIALRPQVDGRLVELLAHEGDPVAGGQLLLRLDDQTARSEVMLAEAALAEAEAQFQRLLNGAHVQERREAECQFQARVAEAEQAQLSWLRSKGLHARGAIATQEYDDKRTDVAAANAIRESAQARFELLSAPAREDDLEMSRARVAAAQARLGLAKVQLLQTEVRAPLAGTVLAVEVARGELAGPDSPEPAIIMADISRYRIRTFVEELDAPRVSVGMKAIITVDGIAGKEFTGQVTELSPRMSRKQLHSDDPTERLDVRTRQVWIDLDGATDLIVGLRVDVSIALGSELQ